MGWETTRIIRVYPKSKPSSFSIQKFCDQISKTARGLDSQILWYKNKTENCFDLKFNTSKASGDLVYNLKEVHLWEIRAHDSGGTGICFYNTEIPSTGSPYFKSAQFGFDKMLIRGTSNAIQEYCELVGLKQSEMHLEGSNGVLNIDLKLKGFYECDNYYPTRNEKDKGQRISRINKEEFLKLRGDSCWIEKIKVNGYPDLNLNEFHELVYGDNMFFSLLLGLEKIEFYYNNRCTKRIQWQSKNNTDQGWWMQSSADSWDNCLNPNWLAFRNNLKLKEYED